MSTSVKVDEERKSRLEELQAEIKLETGKKVTQQELLGRLIDNAYRTRADLIDSFRDEEVSLTDEEVEEFLGFTFDSGTETSEEDIDQILYDHEQS